MKAPSLTDPINRDALGDPFLNMISQTCGLAVVGRIEAMKCQPRLMEALRANVITYSR